MTKSEKAADCFKQGLNCAQAILSVYGEEDGLAKKDALRLTAGFGGGVARSGGICGAVSGALMVIGLRYAKGMESKEKVIFSAREFMNKFKERCGSIMCRELIGIDLNTPEGKKALKEDPEFSKLCSNLVKTAGEILDQFPG